MFRQWKHCCRNHFHFDVWMHWSFLCMPGYFVVGTHLGDLLKIRDNFNSLVTFAAKMKYKRGLFSIDVQSAEKQDVKPNFKSLTTSPPSKDVLPDRSLAIGALVLPSPMLAETRVFHSVCSKLLKTVVVLTIESGSTAYTSVKIFRNCAHVLLLLPIAFNWKKIVF